jgi:hypothetical protein
MKRALARQAEAERERRAKVINAQGELQASQTLAQAARTLSAEPSALQLRYLQTVTEIAAENNSTTIFPIPIEMIRPFIPDLNRPAVGAGQPSAPALPAPAISFDPPGAPMPNSELNALMQQLKLDRAAQAEPAAPVPPAPPAGAKE